MTSSIVFRLLNGTLAFGTRRSFYVRSRLPLAHSLKASSPSRVFILAPACGWRCYADDGPGKGTRDSGVKSPSKNKSKRRKKNAGTRLAGEWNVAQLPSLADDADVAAAAREVAQSVPGDAELIENELLRHLRGGRESSPEPLTIANDADPSPEMAGTAESGADSIPVPSVLDILGSISYDEESRKHRSQQRKKTKSPPPLEESRQSQRLDELSEFKALTEQDLLRTEVIFTKSRNRKGFTPKSRGLDIAPVDQSFGEDLASLEAALSELDDSRWERRGDVLRGNRRTRKHFDKPRDHASPVFSPMLKADGSRKVGLRIFTQPQPNEEDVSLFYDGLDESFRWKESFYDRLQEQEAAITNDRLPTNGFREAIRLTERGELWELPIDNEKNIGAEEDVPFHEHVFIGRLTTDFPKVGPIRNFIDLVCDGLSKNPYMSVEEKRGFIQWYRDYFDEKGLLSAEGEERANM